MLSEEVIKKLINGPAVLLIGQDYLKLETGRDIFLEEILKKYAQRSSLPENPTYDQLLSLGLDKDQESSTAWIENLGRFIPIPSWLQRVASIPWSAVYTSAIDPILSSAFETEWRKIQEVSDDKFKVIDPRNKFNLHITQLYGNVIKLNTNQRAPLNYPEKIKRKYTKNILLQRLPEIITSKGVLIIEGYKPGTDWLEFDDLYSTISLLGENQVIFCSNTNSIEENGLLNDLVESRKALVYNKSFAEIISVLESEGKYRITTPEYEDRFAKYLTIESKKIRIPQDLYNSVTRTATIIDDNIFQYHSYIDDDEKYFGFKKFLATTNLNEIWKGYPQSFAFKRDYYTELKSQVSDKLRFQKVQNSPVILYGQSTGGKTISLGNLAYDIKREYGLPILFIEKRLQRIDEHLIDRFCRWSEEFQAKGTLIIWDGMVEIDAYYDLLEKLSARGRNVVLVGSAYSASDKSPNHIFSSAELSATERNRFDDFLKGIDPILSRLITDHEDNILSLFYRYLPDSRLKIRQGLKSEFDHFTRLIRDYSKSNSNDIPRPPMFQLMKEAGLISENDADFGQEYEMSGDKLPLSDLLIYSIMVPGQFGIEVPFDLLIHRLGFESITSAPFRVLNDINLIVWNEDSTGNIFLGPRTSIEAKILTKYLGGKRIEAEYIKSLLSSVECEDFLSFGYESNLDIQFAVRLLNNIGPNSNNNYWDYLYAIANVLKDLRESGKAYHPRLILKEASFLREIVKKDSIPNEETAYQLLDRAENIVREALQNLPEYQDMTITNYLRVELASILGSKTLNYIQDNTKKDAILTYQAVKNVNSASFVSKPDNYGALDVVAWTTQAVIRSKILSPEDQAEAQISMLSLFDTAEAEGISNQHYNDFYARKHNFFEIFGQTELSNEIFERFSNEGSTAGYYLRTKNIIVETEDTKLSADQLVSKYKKAFEYLKQFEDRIRHDSRCVFLLLKCWWIMKAKSPFFSGEKIALPFTREDWEYCFSLLEILVYNGDLANLATVLYLKGLAEFHLNQITDMSDTFRQLDVLTDFSSYGSRRIIKSYLASTSEGLPRTFSGEIYRDVSLRFNQKIGDIYIQELKTKVPFLLKEFFDSSYQKGQQIRNFQIGFNFRGPIAVSNKHN